MKDRNLALIVDDSELNRSMLADILSDEYDIIEAENGLEAISQFEKHQFDISLVLLDIVMPEMDGFEVLAIMSKNKWIERVPVIIISAESSSSYTRQRLRPRRHRIHQPTLRPQDRATARVEHRDAVLQAEHAGEHGDRADAR